MSKDSHNLYKIIGKSILLASMQFAIGSVEMSSKFSVINFSKDQETLKRASDALNEYMLIGFIWTIGVVLIMYANYGKTGAISGILSNFFILGWIYISYKSSFKKAAKFNNLKNI
jgi:hypothetical protein